MKSKKMIIILSICTVFILIAIISLILLRINNSKDEENNISKVDTSSFEGDSYVYQSQKVTDANIFYSVSFCIEKYYNNLYINHETYDEEMINDIKSNLFHTLDEKYKERKGITEQNILDKIDILEEQVQFTAVKMNSIVGEQFSNYAVEGILTKPDTKEYIGKQYFNIIVYNTNNTYAIIPIEEEDFEIEQIDLSLDNLSRINRNEDNEFVITTMNYSILLKNYMMYYKNMAIYYPEIAYELIETNYRNAKFNNKEEFYGYINTHMEELETLTLDKYQITNLDNYVQYVVLDTKGKYYVFKEDGIMNFKIILDTYTMDLDEFMNKYNKADKQEKTGMNIEKVINAINDKDYRYVYNKLDNTFKSNNYGSLDEFQKSIENLFFNYNELEYKKYTESGGLCIYEIEMKNKENETEESKKLTIIMQLQEGTDFRMSFSME